MAILRWRPMAQSVERWDPFREVGDFQSELNRVFDGFLGRSGTMPGGDRVWAPAVDMYETKDDLVVAAELPGVSEKEMQLSITGDVLSLKGERTLNQDTKQESFYRGERWYGRFERTLAADSRAGRQGQGDVSRRRAHDHSAQGGGDQAQGDQDRRSVSPVPAGRASPPPAEPGAQGADDI